MNGCQLLTVLIHLIELNDNNNIRVARRTDRQYIEGAVIFIGNSASTTLQREMIDIQDRIIKLTDTSFPDLPYYQPKRTVKPWYVEAGEKGGNKKRKPFIK